MTVLLGEGQGVTRSRIDKGGPSGRPAAPHEMRGPVLYAMISVLLCVQIIDGLDMLSLAFVGPAISAELGLNRSQLGACIGIAFLGMALGAMFFGWLAGRVGKKRTLLGLVVLMIPTSLATSHAGGAISLFTLRFLMGLVLGGIFPVAAAIILERAPATIRTTAVSVLSAGASLGAIACGFVASFIVPVFGWRSMFVVNGLLPFVLIPAVLWAIPRSVSSPAGDAAPDKDGAAAGARDRSSAWKSLLPVTGLLWGASFFCALPVFFVVGWLPTLAKAAGVTATEAAFGASLFTTVGALGGIVAARLVDRFGLRITPLLTALAAIAVAVLGLAIGTHLLSVAVFFAGVLAFGLFTLTAAVAGQLYPPAIRAFGVGCGLAIMRVGSTIGPWIGGVALDAGLSAHALFLIAGGFIAVGGAFLWLLGRASHNTLLGFGAAGQSSEPTGQAHAGQRQR